MKKTSNNNFSAKNRELFDEHYRCNWCGISHADCLHHIMGRGDKYSKCESSPLNASPMSNDYCHLPNHSDLRKFDVRVKLLEKTYLYLVYKKKYLLDEKDVQFMEKYNDYYKKTKIKKTKEST